MQQQAEKIGKNLEEQLKNGQAQAAQERMQKMIEQLKKNDLSQKDLAEIGQECKNGSKPGDKFGKVGEHLKKAAEKAQKGDKQGSKESLAEAQKELNELMNQMNDAQSLMAAMQALQKAQACVGNGNCWGDKAGMGKAGGTGKPRGKGKRGFGDWSSEYPWALPDQIADSWDNSGLNRNDKTAKGLTDRDPTTPENLSPTKIMGQFQPGGPMPSITLKGVSIKGDCKVAYTEAVTAAQSDAQAALTQEQVPKAYKNAVRDYFDDLK